VVEKNGELLAQNDVSINFFDISLSNQFYTAS